MNRKLEYYVYNIASKFVHSNSIARGCFIFLFVTLMMSTLNNWFMRQLCVYRDMIEALGKFARETLTHLSCSPSFPRASYLSKRTLTHEPEPIVK